MLIPGQRLDLTVEKPAAGGRMIARHDGQVVLVAGAIPGERVSARVERVERRLAFANVEAVHDPSPDRREPDADPACGGCAYAHIVPARQVDLKAAIIADACARIGRVPLATPIPMSGSADRGYRIRARLHVHRGQFGFYREHSHTICDAASTGQLGDGLLAAATNLVGALTMAGVAPTSVEMSENLAADQRIAHVEVEGRVPPRSDLEALTGPELQGVSVSGGTGQRAAAGVNRIEDPLAVLTAGRAQGVVGRGAESFFQGNRFLLPSLVIAVVDAVPPGGEVLDLYAGVGLFALALAGTGRTGITAVEGQGASGVDLRDNAARFPAVTAVLGAVEQQIARLSARPATVIVDPPRTGLSGEVVEALTRLRPATVVYVSCDPATLARDARRLLESGYALTSLQGFDLFPNTAHVEALAVLKRIRE